jgi:hypothetical protein
MEDIKHDGLMGHLGMVGGGIVDGIVLAFADVRGKRLPAVVVGGPGRRVLAIVLDKIPDKRVGAGSVVGRVGQGQDVLVGAEGESLRSGGKLRVLEFLPQLVQEVLPPGRIIGEGQPQAFYRFLVPGIWFLVGERGFWFVSGFLVPWLSFVFLTSQVRLLEVIHKTGDKFSWWKVRQTIRWK